MKKALKLTNKGYLEVDASTYSKKLDDEFKCLNKKCPAKLIYVSSFGSSKPYFRAKEVHSHLPDCDYYCSSPSNTRFTDAGFDLNDALTHILSTKTSSLTKKGKINNKKDKSDHSIKPRNLKSIYLAFLDNIGGTFGSSVVNDILCCDETFSNHTSNLNGILLVKCKFGYNTNKPLTLGLYYPFSMIPEQKHLEIKFVDEDFYKYFFNLALNNKKYSILIFAEFVNNVCTIENRNQITILNNE